MIQRSAHPAVFGSCTLNAAVAPPDAIRHPSISTPFGSCMRTLLVDPDRLHLEIICDDGFTVEGVPAAPQPPTTMECVHPMKESLIAYTLIVCAHLMPTV